MSAERTHWGWHQLTDRWAAHIVADAGIGPGDLVLDIGAGHGALTQRLVEHGARVIAFELNVPRAAELRRRFGACDVKVVVADALDLRLPTRRFRVVANPPFAASTAILRRLVAPGSRLVRADLVVPWHAAERWTSARAPGLGRWGGQFTIRRGRPLPRSAFSPPAPGGVAIVVIERREGAGSIVRRPGSWS